MWRQQRGSFSHNKDISVPIKLYIKVKNWEYVVAKPQYICDLVCEKGSNSITKYPSLIDHNS